MSRVLPAHIWVPQWKPSHVYIGGFAEEECAAEAYDVMALKVKGAGAKLNFPASKYAVLSEFINDLTPQELTLAIRRESQSCSRGSSKFRGVTRHKNGKWVSQMQARIGTAGTNVASLTQNKHTSRSARQSFVIDAQSPQSARRRDARESDHHATTPTVGSQQAHSRRHSSSQCTFTIHQLCHLG